MGPSRRAGCMPRVFRSVSLVLLFGQDDNMLHRSLFTLAIATALAYGGDAFSAADANLESRDASVAATAETDTRQAEHQEQAQTNSPKRTITRPLDTIVVIGRPTEIDRASMAVEPIRPQRLTTLPDLFAGTPGILAQANFGGVDHPRLSIRGSGLQRGTQPAGRGIDLRLNSLPMGYADTSYDFIEWIEPLAFDRVVVLRGGRGAVENASTLGGVIDFQTKTGASADARLVRLESGSFGAERAQLSWSERGEQGEVYASASRFRSDGWREFAGQKADRLITSGSWFVHPAVQLSADWAYSSSELELPGPMRLTDLRAGSRAAQPANVAGDWTRFSDRNRLSLGLRTDALPGELQAALGYHHTEIEFRRRDVQEEDNEDWIFSADWLLPGDRLDWQFSLLAQRGQRDQAQFLNGGGTRPSFTGQRGLQWADHDLRAERDRLSAGLEYRLNPQTSLSVNLGWEQHQREAHDRFPTRPERPTVEFDESYSDWGGLLMLRQSVNPGLEWFAAVSRVNEPPTFDALLINVAGMGAGPALIDGPNPRRPVFVPLEMQRADTVEAGIRAGNERVSLDLTIYQGWLSNEIASTSDPVSQTVSSVGNIDRSTRRGIEAFGQWRIQDWLNLSASWTHTDARQRRGAPFPDRQLPIVPRNVLAFGADARFGEGWFTSLRAEHLPNGAWVDYANTLRAPGYTSYSLRAGREWGGLTLFVDGRNLTDRRHVSTVIAAQNNLNGADSASFAPAEGRAVFFGLEWVL